MDRQRRTEEFNLPSPSVTRPWVQSYTSAKTSHEHPPVLHRGAATHPADSPPRLSSSSTSQKRRTKLLLVFYESIILLFTFIVKGAFPMGKKASPS